MKDVLVRMFGVPFEEPPAEFYRDHRWLGDRTRTPAELRWQRTVRGVLVLMGCAVVAFVFYWLS